MKNMILHTRGIHSLRLPSIFRIVAVVVLGSILLPASPTLAHHGWDGHIGYKSRSLSTAYRPYWPDNRHPYWDSTAKCAGNHNCRLWCCAVEAWATHLGSNQHRSIS